MIFVGIDDTDIIGSPGTNQLARVLAAEVAREFRCNFIIRHQLLNDPRVHYTSKNGSASIWLSPRNESAPSLVELIQTLRHRMLEWYVPGSDPGLCVTQKVPEEIVDWGWRCQRELVNQQLARNLAAKHGIYLEGLGGTEGGITGALAAVGLAATGNDGRVVVQGEWPDDFSGSTSIEAIRARSISVRCLDSNQEILHGMVDVGKHMRPNCRQGQVVLFVRPHLEPGPVEPAPAEPVVALPTWVAVRLT